MAASMALQAGSCPSLVNRSVDSHPLSVSRSTWTAPLLGKRSFRAASPFAELAPCSLWGQRTSPAVSMAVQSADADGKHLARAPCTSATLEYSGETAELFCGVQQLRRLWSLRSVSREWSVRAARLVLQALCRSVTQPVSFPEVAYSLRDMHVVLYI